MFKRIEGIYNEKQHREAQREQISLFSTCKKRFQEKIQGHVSRNDLERALTAFNAPDYEPRIQKSVSA